jgi:CheY-like chemotaxis protein
MRSPELAARARQRMPGIAVLFTSGYTENSIVHAGRLDEGVELLSKPYTQEALALKLRQVLSARARITSTTDGSSAPWSRHANAEPSRILLCEDDASIRLTVKDMLESRGYVVIDVGSAETAIEAYRRESIDLLVTDLILPGTSGIDLMQKLRQINATLPLVFTTGRFDKNAGLLDARTKVLLKPYSGDALVQTISRLLGQGGP